MPAVLDLIWSPTTAHPKPPDGQAEAIYRNATCTVLFRMWAGTSHTAALVLPVGATYAAQFRLNRLALGVEPDEPLAEAIITLGEETINTIVVPTITLTLTPAMTLILPKKGFWDMDQNIDDDPPIITPLFSGKFRVLDDVTRVT